MQGWRSDPTGDAAAFHPHRDDSVTRAGAIVAMTIVGAIAAFGVSFAIAKNNLWLDEAYSFSFATSDWPRFVAAIHHVDGPLAAYYLALRVWLAAFGASETALRSFSLLWAVASIPLAYRLGAGLFTRSVGVFVAILVAFNAFWFDHAKDGRVYSLTLFLSLCATLAFVDVMREGPTAWRTLRYLVFIALALAFHAIIAGLMVIAHVASAPLLRSPSISAKRYVPVALGLVTVAVATVGAFTQLGSTQNTWLSRPSAHAALSAVLWLGGEKLAFIFIVSLTSYAIAIALRTRDRTVLVVLVWFLAPLVAALIISSFKPIFLARYLFAALVPLLVLTAVGIDRLRPRWVAFAVLAITVASEAVGTRHEVHKSGEAWQDAARMVAARATPGDLIVFDPACVAVPYATAARRAQVPIPEGAVVLPHDWAHAGAAEFVCAVATRAALFQSQPTGTRRGSSSTTEAVLPQPSGSLR
jgi:mannosyltransferase